MIARLRRPGERFFVEGLERRVLFDAVAVGPVEVVAATTEIGALVRAQVASDEHGNFVVVWNKYLGDTPGEAHDFDVFARLYDAAGNPRGDPFVVSGDSGDQINPAVAMDAAGDFVVTWQHHAVNRFSDFGRIMARRFDAAGSPLSGAFPVGTGLASEYEPHVAMNADGASVITWRRHAHDERLGDDDDVFARKYDRFGGTSAPVEVALTRGGYADSDVAMDAAGGFVVAWVQDYTSLFFRRFDPAARPLGEKVLVANGTPQFVSLAADDDGDFVIAWDGNEITNPLLTRRFDRSGAPRGDAQVVSPDNGRFWVEPRVDMDGDGNYAVTWDVRVGQGLTEIRARAYRADGSANGGELFVHSIGRAGPEDLHPSVALDADGDMVVAWEGWDSFADESRIMARRYGGAADPPPPRVAGVLVGGTRWSPRFGRDLESRGLGRQGSGFLVPAGPAPGGPLPWSNVDQVSILFTRDVLVAADDLTVRGTAGGLYGFAAAGETPAFHYDAATHTATWTLARTVGGDRLTLTLDGGPAGVRAASGGKRLDGDGTGAAYPSGDGAEGGDFRFAFDVLPGDANRDGRVTGADVLRARALHGVETDETDAPPATVFADINASNQVTLADQVVVRRSLGRALPPAPAATGGAPGTTGGRAPFAPRLRRQLFAESAILPG
jgi:hypothetical protein